MGKRLRTTLFAGRRRKAAVAGIAFLVCLAGGSSAFAGATGADKPTHAGPPAAFSQCLGCHTVESGKHGFGPSLAGVAGRKAATLSDYAFSKALKESGLTWDADTLRNWLASPQKLVPGTRMPFFGIRDAGTRDEVVQYLLSLE